MQNHPVDQYALDVVEDRILACKWVRLACERHLRDIDSGHLRGLWFDYGAADRALSFFRFLRHSKGEWAGCQFELSPWQRFIVGCLFGWKRQDGLRRFRAAYIEVPRKNGKSTLLAGIALYLLVADDEPGAEIYTAATKRDQAKIIWTEAANMVQKSPALRKRINVSRARSNMNSEATASKFEALGADSDTLDGLNIHGAIVDELHAHKDRGIWDVLDTGTGARRQPILVAITTAGLEQNSICWEQHEYVCKILERVIEDDTYFGYITAIDEGDDWEDPKTWAKANPNLGVSVKYDDLERKAKKAKESPAALAAFLRLHLNVWTQAETPWMPLDRWDAAAGTADTDMLQGRTCFGAFDLSTSIDITAGVLVFPVEGGSYQVLCRFWLPEVGLQERVKHDRVPYDLWVRQGYIELIQGSELIDDQYVRRWFRECGEKYHIQEIAFDKWNALSLANDLAADGFTMVDFPQTISQFTGPTKGLVDLVLQGKLIHGGNPVLRWMASCMTVKQDANENIRPVKPDRKQSSKRIDGMVALIMALSRALVHQNTSMYDEKLQIWY